jgi:DNA invertase Pin-like site-specific DNA recombinase
MRIIAYARVSTAREAASSLWLASQPQAIEGYAERRAATIHGRFTDVESGRNPDLPQLAKSRHPAEVTGATLVIA